LTEQTPEYLEAIINASKALNVPIQDLTLDQFRDYVDQNSNERRKALTITMPEVVQASEWEKVKELAIIIDSANKQIAEKYRFNLGSSTIRPSEQNWKFGQFIPINNRRRVVELSIFATFLSVLLSVGILFLITLFNQSIAFEQGIIPTIAIPLVIGPIVSFIIFTQSYHLTRTMNQLDELNRTDDLTGLYNRRFFTELVEMELAVASRYEFPSSLLLIDLDHFRRVNDFYGYRTGDEVIRIIADVIKNNIRRSDVIGRFGGEEMIVFLPHTKLEGAMVAAERIRRIISESEILFEDDQIQVTASIGAVSTGIEIKNIEQLIQAAGSALDMAKERGRDLVECLPHLSQESAVAPEIIEVQPR